MKLSDFLTGIGRPVAVYPALSNMLGFTESGFLCQLLYWSDKGSRGDGWVYKSQAEWTTELGLSRREQETVRRNLKAKNIIEEHYNRLAHRLYFRVKTDKLEELWEAEQTKLANGGNERYRMAESAIRKSTKAPFGKGENCHSLYQSENTSIENKQTTTTTRLRGRAASRPGSRGGSFVFSEKTTSPAMRDSVKQGNEASTTASSENRAKPQPPGSALPPFHELAEDQFLRGFAAVWSKTSLSEYEDELSPWEIDRVRKLLRKTRSDWKDHGLKGLILRFAFARYAWKHYAHGTIVEAGEFDAAIFPSKHSQNIGIFFAQLAPVGRWYVAHIKGAARGGFDERSTRNIVTSVARHCDAAWLAEKFIADNEEDFKEACPEIGDRKPITEGKHAGKESIWDGKHWFVREIADEEDAYAAATIGHCDDDPVDDDDVVVSM